MFKRALSVLLTLGLICGLVSTPAQAVSDRYVYCSTSGSIKIKDNMVAQKTPSEGALANKCIGTAVVPDGVARLDDYSMADETGLTSIVIPDTVTAIGANALAGTRISRLIIPASVVSISSGAFAYNPNMTSLIIPASVRTLSYFIGWQNTNLTKIYFLGKTAPTTHADAFSGIGTGAIAYVPAGSTGYNASGSGYSVDGETWKRLSVSASGAIVVYEGNGAASGTAPDDANLYGVGDLVTVLANTAVAPNASLSRANHVFDGWTLEKDGGGTVLQPGDKFVAQAGANVLYANWVGDPKVKYNGNGNTGGTAPFDLNSPYAPGSTVLVLGNSELLEKTGHEFDGWNTKADGTGTTYAAASTLTVATSNVTLFAKWKAETHTVTYEGNGSTGGSVPVDGASPHNYNTSVTVLGAGNLTRTGYEFAGWNTLASGLGTDRAANSNFTITSSDIVLHAKWTIKSNGITYDGNQNTGGTVPVDAVSHNYNTSVTALENSGNLSRTGYDFAGWNTLASGLGTDRAENAIFTMGDEDITLYAKWDIKSYGVTYDGNENTDGSVPVDATPHAFGSSVYIYYQGDIAKSGYKFDGWNTASDGSGTQYGYPAAFNMPAENVTLYAQWSNMGQVDYYANGATEGDVPSDNDHTFGSTVTVLTNSGVLERPGYTFASWNTEADGSGTSYAATGLITFVMPEDDVSLYAIWEAVPAPNKPTSGNGEATISVQVPATFNSMTLPLAYKNSLKNAVKKYGKSADFNITCEAGTLSAANQCKKAVTKYLRSLGVKQSSIHVNIKAKECGTKRKISSIQIRFGYGSSTLTKANKKSLQCIASKLVTSHNYVIISGVGEVANVKKAHLKNLAKKRGQVVRSYLRSLGVKDISIQIKVKIFSPGITPKTKIISKLLTS